MTTGERIQQAREAAGYATARAFAEALGVPPGTVYSWEGPAKGKTPRLRTLRRIAEFLQVPLETLTGEAAPPQAPEPAPATPAPAQSHPGVEALAADAALRARHHVTDVEMDRLRQVSSLPGGLVIATAEAALRFVDAFRAAQLPS